MQRFMSSMACLCTVMNHPACKSRYIWARGLRGPFSLCDSHRLQHGALSSLENRCAVHPVSPESSQSRYPRFTRCIGSGAVQVRGRLGSWLGCPTFFPQNTAGPTADDYQTSRPSVTCSRSRDSFLSSTSTTPSTTTRFPPRHRAPRRGLQWRILEK